MSTNTPIIARSKPANFNWEDPFLLEDQLTEEERMIRDTSKAYCQDKLMPRIIEANWPEDDVISLWIYLKKHGSRLGGNTGPYALRTLGVDTFLMTVDVETFLRNHNIVDSGTHSLRALKAAQSYFNELREESGRNLSELSRLVSLGIGRNQVN